ncbi:MAG: isocitrate lyase/PEP mutase family protein [Alphaproteobacteria bacterium]
MRKTTRFRQLVEAPEILNLVGVHDALSARIAENAGFSALTAGGYAATATLLGAPDTGQLTMSEMADFYTRLCEATTLPVFGDGDTGFGNVINVARTVRAYERAGLAGMFIEDQVSPKRCGHMAGKAVVDTPEMVAKLKAALDARTDPDFIIMARTDANAVHGLDAAFERGKIFAQFGADMVFVEAPTDTGQMAAIAAQIDAPTTANNIEGGATPILPPQELQEMGFAVVVHPVASLYCVHQALIDFYATLKRDGTSAAMQSKMTDFGRFHDLVGLHDLRQKEAGYAHFAKSVAERAQDK